MAKIIEMSTSLANMIAAGEVVERPSNVLKELVENSIDAGAKTITISVVEGGIKEIKVIDDGFGMEREDLELCFKSHATSKIKNEYDLVRVKTLGFRGEAIPSIAAVSKMTISSSTTGSNGYQIAYKFGRKILQEPVSHNIGTTVLVSDLFYNTPVRLKYLKSPEKELASITYLVDKLALTNPGISFKLYSDEKLIFNTNGNGDMTSLIGEIYGLEAARKLCKVSFEESGYEGTFYYVKPEIYRSNKLHLTYIVNGRYVRNNALNEMVVKAFDQFLPINKYPILVLYLTIDPLLIDVNVHPKKAEIRIADELDVVETLRKILRSSLEKTRQIPQKSISIEEKTFTSNKNDEFRFDNSKLFQDEINTNTFKETNISYSLFDSEPEKEDKIENIILNEQPTYNKLPELFYVGIIFKTYIIFENETGMYLVDQHAAAERIRYEKYAELLGDLNQPTTSLLIPITIDFTKDEMLFIEEHKEEFNKLGFSIEQLDQTSYAIREVPLWAQNKEIEDVVRELLSDMIRTKNVSILPFRDKIAKQISCKSSIRANDYIGKEEALALIKDLNKCQNPYHCPHGRPTIIKFTQNELKKMFERIQSK